MKKERLILLTFSLFFLLIVVKLFFLQIIAPVADASDKYLNYKKINPIRGKILDRFGHPLALNKRSYLLFVEPKKMKDSQEATEKIDSVLKVGESTLESKIDTHKEWIAVDQNISKEAKEKLESLKIPGVGFEEKYQRFYPESSLAAHLLGFVGKNQGGENTGYFGIEGYYDKDLSGLPGLLKSERDLLGRPILLGTQDKIAQDDGSDLYLTIDASVQRIIKQELIKGIERYKASSGCVITADPFTMEILGLACIPDYDLENYFKFKDRDFKNQAISASYEPGSTFKPLVVAAALAEKKIKPTDLYNEQGPVEVGGYTIRTWNNKYEGKISITRILEKSSNVGMVYIEKKLGDENMYKYVKNYGFGNPTGIDLQGEVEGVLKSRQNWYPIDYATVSFGQGIAVTPIQMITAFASLVNGGDLITPSLVKKISYGSEQRELEDKPKKRIIDENTSEIIKRMLVSTVLHGEYKWAIPEGYIIGGKTGTAQIPIAGHYDASKTIASFIGFAPADKPKFITLVVLSEPKTSPWGSETAAPLFFDIARELFLYYNIAPEQ